MLVYQRVIHRFILKQGQLDDLPNKDRKVIKKPPVGQGLVMTSFLFASTWNQSKRLKGNDLEPWSESQTRRLKHTTNHKAQNNNNGNV